METAPNSGPLQTRGALSNKTNRFEPAATVRIDDGWGSADAPALRLETTLTRDRSKTVIARNRSPDVPFDRSINPYRGCEHGCVYCFARPTHAWLGLSPGLDFETKLLMKPDAPEILERELRKPGYTCRTIAMGTNTDPYQPVEGKQRITRRILEVLERFGHPVSIVTKSALVLRDIDILSGMAGRNLASVALSVTTLDRDLARKMEPRAATPDRRLDAIRQLSGAGIPVSVMAAPMIPAVNDLELEAILEAAADAGARTADYILLRLPLEVKDLFVEWLEAHFPDRAQKVLAIIRETRGGKLYESEFGGRMRGQGVHAELLERRFANALRKFDLARTGSGLDTRQFEVPIANGNQLSLF